MPASASQDPDQAWLRRPQKRRNVPALKRSDDNICTAISRGARDHAVLAHLRRPVDRIGDRTQPRPAIVAGERNVSAAVDFIEKQTANFFRGV